MKDCNRCGAMLAKVAPQMARHWIGLTTGNSSRRGARPVTVCPACDCYAIGAEMTIGLPFYSDAIAAFATVQDWDWSNRDPAECDIRDWPDFGCLTFSEHALRGAICYLREAEPGSVASDAPLPFDRKLVGPTGIPEDINAEAEWANQLGILQARMQGEYSERELDVAVRTLISVIASGKAKNATRDVARTIAIKHRHYSGTDQTPTARIPVMELQDEFPESRGWPAVLDERTDIAATPAVYALLHERPFGRLRGESPILYIGCTGELGGMSDQCRLRIYRYPNGAHAQEIRNRTRRLEDDGVAVSLAWTHLPSREDAFALEAHLLQRYEADHGELPPFNRRF